MSSALPLTEKLDKVYFREDTERKRSVLILWAAAGLGITHNVNRQQNKPCSTFAMPLIDGLPYSQLCSASQPSLDWIKEEMRSVSSHWELRPLL